MQIARKTTYHSQVIQTVVSRTKTSLLEEPITIKYLKALSFRFSSIVNIRTCVDSRSHGGLLRFNRRPEIKPQTVPAVGWLPTYPPATSLRVQRRTYPAAPSSCPGSPTAAVLVVVVRLAAAVIEAPQFRTLDLHEPAADCAEAAHVCGVRPESHRSHSVCGAELAFSAVFQSECRVSGAFLTSHPRLVTLRLSDCPFRGAKDSRAYAPANHVPKIRNCCRCIRSKEINSAWLSNTLHRHI